MIKNKRLLVYFSLFISLTGSQVTSTVMATTMTNDELQRLSTMSNKSNEISDTIAISNMFGRISQDKTIARGGKTVMQLGVYNIGDHSMRLPSIYLVLPKGITAANGLTGVKKVVAEYEEYRQVKGHLNVSQLPSTDDNREVYQILPTKGAYTLPSEAVKLMELPVEVSEDAPDTIRFNAKNDVDVKNDDVIFVGAGNGNDVSFTELSKKNYHAFDAKFVGIQSNEDQVVRGIVYPSYYLENQVFTPKIKDTYKIVSETDNNKLIKIITKQGELGTNYSRKGLINNLTDMHLDTKIYDEKSLKIDHGKLDDDINLTTARENISNDPNQVNEGRSYQVSVKRFAQPITVHYVDETGTKIHDDQILNGDVGDDYDLSTPKYKLDLAGYELDSNQIPTNINGKFGDNPITVTYKYNKKKVSVLKPNNSRENSILKNYNSGQIDSRILRIPEVQNWYEVALLNHSIPRKANNQSNQFPKLHHFDMATELSKNNINQNVKKSTQKEKKKNQKVKKKNKYALIIRYVDEDGNAVAKDKILTGVKGDKYSSKAKHIEDYSLKTDTKAISGIFGENSRNEVFHYKKQKVNKSSAKNNNSLPEMGENVSLNNTVTLIGMLSILSMIYLNFKGKRNSEKINNSE